MSAIIDKIDQEQQKTDIPEFGVGDSVKIHCLVREGEKERTQIFAGLVIARKGGGVNASYTVRKISYGEGVERIFPVHTPTCCQNRSGIPRPRPSCQASLSPRPCW